MLFFLRATWPGRATVTSLVGNGNSSCSSAYVISALCSKVCKSQCNKVCSKICVVRCIAKSVYLVNPCTSFPRYVVKYVVNCVLKYVVNCVLKCVVKSSTRDHFDATSVCARAREHIRYREQIL